MKALTISQPYASLIALGSKWVENRTWATKFRGWLAIHAGKGQQYMKHERMKEMKIPFGVIVGLARMSDCVSIDVIRHHASMQKLGGEPKESIGNRSYRQLATHEHTEGPYCWVFDHVIRLEKPIPCKGAQGLWVPEKHIELKLTTLISVHFAA